MLGWIPVVTIHVTSLRGEEDLLNQRAVGTSTVLRTFLKYNGSRRMNQHPLGEDRNTIR